MKVFIDADHNGYALHQYLITELTKLGHEVQDVDTALRDPDDDYPIVAKRAITPMLAEKNAIAILLCGSGQGICMAANRFKGVRALLGYDVETVKSARNDDDANVLCLPARRLTDAQALDLAVTFIATPFANAPRYVRRIREMDDL